MKKQPFIVDVPASFLKRSAGLSKDARQLYGTMRALANGKTGELAIRGNPLDWRYIVRHAEMGRDRWQWALKELLAGGLASRERERVVIHKDGRKRVVWGRVRYFVHKQPKSTKKPMILPMPDSSAAEESGTQSSSETPRGASLNVLRSARPVRHLERDESSSPRDDAVFPESLMRQAGTVLAEQYPHWKPWQVELAVWTVMGNAYNSGKVPRSPQYFVTGVNNLTNGELDFIENYWNEESFRAWLAHTRERGNGRSP
jgi:hypothetical protein